MAISHYFRTQYFRQNPKLHKYELTIKKIRSRFSLVFILLVARNPVSISLDFIAYFGVNNFSQPALPFPGKILLAYELEKSFEIPYRRTRL